MTDGMTDPTALPWVISVDDHVVEPPHVWETWLPERFRDRGPRVLQDTCQTIVEPGAAAARHVRGGDGPVVDWWTFEDLLRPLVSEKTLATANKYVKLLWGERANENLIRSINPLSEVEV